MAINSREIQCCVHENFDSFLEAHTFGGHDSIISGGTNNFCDTFVKIHVLSVDVGKSMFDRALIHLQFDNLLLDMVGIQLCFGVYR